MKLKTTKKLNKQTVNTPTKAIHHIYTLTEFELHATTLQHSLTHIHSLTCAANVVFYFLYLHSVHARSVLNLH